MTRIVGIARWVLLLSVVATIAGACVATPDSPTAASAANDNALALSFDRMSVESFALGDIDRGNEFRWAAVAVRSGVMPSRLVLSNNGIVESYEAFVHTVASAPAVGQAASFATRSLVAWRATQELLHVMIIASPTATASVAHPAALISSTPTSPVITAHAAWFVRSNNAATWLGVSGTAKLAETTTAGACEQATNVLSGVSCSKASYSVAFEVNLVPSRGNTREVEVNASATRKISASEQRVNAGKLLFACPMGRVSSSGGCS